jgi:SAM-dependent methyltransferase
VAESQYDVERELADRLKAADASKRADIYGAVYQELYARVPDHPQLRRKDEAGARRRQAERDIRWLGPDLDASYVFLEIGAGDGLFALEAARRCRVVYAVEPSGLLDGGVWPPNLEFIADSDPSLASVPERIDVAFSDQMIEHLHADDALRHFSGVRRVLSVGGCYYFRTPSRLSGPHDVSRGKDVVATGLHLKEYSYTELRAILRRSAFTNLQPYVRVGGRYVRVPGGILLAFEIALERLPVAWRQRIARSSVGTRVLGVAVRAS